MYSRALRLLILCLLCLDDIVHSMDRDWNYHLWLDPKYSLKWNVDSDKQTITFLCEVQTLGWIGFGLSPNGGMKGSDIVIAWVDDTSGTTHFNDRFATGESLPEIDESQDWDLLSSEQNGTHTIIKFSRPLISCDKTYDRDITRDTIRVIYAFSDSDPKSESDIRMHGRHQRGVRSVLLLSQVESMKNEPKEPDLQTFVLNVKNLTIPPKETTYWCKIFKMPEDKIHVVKFKPHITPNNEPFAHHMTVSACFHPNSITLEKYLDHEGSDCTEEANMAKDFKHCFNPYFMWAVGAGAFLLPKDVGFPLGDSQTYLMLNIHYDNPELVGGVIDSSGLELYYTKNYRKYEAYTMSVGSAMDNRIFVPPKQPNFHITGHCNTRCFENVMDPNGINVFAVWPHAHLLAKKIKTRHFRGNQELPWLEFDQNYDYNLQSFRNLDPTVKIKIGDQITVECEYDSTHRNSTVLGGFGSRDEMCNAFLLYYPKMIPSKPCFSGQTTQTTKTLADIDLNSKLDSTSGLPEYLATKRDWNQKTLNRSHEVMLSAKQKLECYWFKTDKDIHYEDVGYPQLTQIYSPQELKCSSRDHIGGHKSRVTIIVAVIVVLVVIASMVLIYYLRKRSPKRVNRLILTNPNENF